jgi:glycosyltransferase involved in cell wall biosynthesis
MRIGIDLRHITLGPSGGIAPLVRDVVTAAVLRHGEHQWCIFTTIFNAELIEVSSPSLAIVPLPLSSFWSQLDFQIAERRIDVLFRSYPVVDSLQFPLNRQLVLIPDIQHELLPEFFAWHVLANRRAGFNRFLRSAGAIGTISEYARHTIIDSPLTRCRDVFLMPPAGHRSLEATIEIDSEFAARVRAIGPFFLFPANLWPHKNHQRLFDALATFRRRTGRDVALILTGHDDQWPALRQRNLPLPLHHLGFVSRAQLRYLYRHALALTFFSLYEGFGIPILEAFESDCPVLCSNTTSLPEVGGDAVLTCDPMDADAMAELMTRIVTEPGLRETLVQRGKATQELYSWERSADALVDACRRVAGSPPAPVEIRETPLVSIVTPSYNQGRFIRRTIESVLNQSYPNIEYIVVDGASTDDTRQILESYDNRFQWVSEPDDGQTNAINKGFARARGEIRAFLNSDDVLDPDAVAQVVEYFAANPTCDMVYGNAHYVDIEDRITGTYTTAPYSFERLMFDCCVCQPAAFWRATIAQRVGPFDESLDFVMDYDYWLRIDRAGGVIQHLPVVLASSRLYPETKTLSSRDRIYQEIFSICMRHGGYISRNYLTGYWHHRFWEKPTTVTRAIRRIPRSLPVAALLHDKWINRGRKAAGSGSRATVARIARKIASRLSRRVERLRTEGLVGGVTAAVNGYFADGWLAPRATFNTPTVRSGAALYLAGHAARDCKMTISTGGNPAITLELAANRHARATITPKPGAAIAVMFSDSTVDAAGRRLSFYISSTNFFAESDL